MAGREPGVDLSKSTIREYSHQIGWARSDRAAYEKEWEESYRYYLGDQFGDRPVQIAGPIVVNKFWPLVQAALPQLFYKNPYVFVKPTQRWLNATDDLGRPVQIDLEANSRCAETLINMLWRQRRMHRHIRESIVDAFVYSVGYIMTGYSSERGVPEEDRRLSDVESEILSQLQELIPGFSERDLFRFSRTGEVLEFDSNIRPGYPWSRRLNPMMVWIDPRATSLEDARWLIDAADYQIRSLQKDPLFFNTRNLKPESEAQASSDVVGGFEQGWGLLGQRVHYRQAPLPDSYASGDSDPVKRVRVYRMWDRERQQVISLVRQQSDDYSGEGYRVIQAVGWPYREIRDFPVKALRLNIIPNRFYPATGIAHWIEQQRELNLYRSIMADHVRKHGRKIFVEEDFCSDEEWGKLQNPGAGHLVRVRPGKAKDAWSPMEFGSVSPDLYAMEARVKQDIMEITGFAASPNAMGQPNPRITSATEVATMSHAVATLLDDALNNISEFLADVSRDQFMIYRQYFTKQMVIERCHLMEGKEWVEVKPDSLKGEFDFVIDVGSTQKQSQEGRQKQAIDLLTLVMNPVLMQMMGPDVVMEMLRRTFRAFNIEFPDDLTDRAKEWIPPVERAKLEVAKERNLQQQQQKMMGAGPGPETGRLQPNQFGGGAVKPPGVNGGGFGEASTLADTLRGIGGG